MGTTTDQNGNFSLDISRYATMPITVSAIGYYSVVVSDYSVDIPLIINLKPKIYKIKEVVINPDKSLRRKREECLQIFKNAFLGTTENSQRCKIINENDISFNYYSDHDTLKAFASKPILVENRALGYNITYYLDIFEYYKKSKRIYFSGNILFDEATTFKERPQQYYERKRKYAYLGSRMHFFRTLYAEDSTSTGFTVFDTTSHKLSFKRIVTQDINGQKFVRSTGDLRIYYYQNYSRISFLTLNAYFDQNGYFDPQSFEWDGDLAVKRIADWLPYEYKLE